MTLNTANDNTANNKIADKLGVQSAMDQESLLRQFWLRSLLAVGILWGTMPFITVPFLHRGVNSTMFGVIATACNGLTVLPACILAFWHRRSACMWLTASAVLVSIAVVSYVHRTGQPDWTAIMGAVVSLGIAGCLDYMEIMRWPAALDR